MFIRAQLCCLASYLDTIVADLHYRDFTYLEIRTARREDYFVRLERLSFSSQGAVHVHPLLKKSVENRHQCRLMVVPPQAELLVVVHDAV